MIVIGNERAEPKFSFPKKKYIYFEAINCHYALIFFNTITITNTNI